MGWLGSFLKWVEGKAPLDLMFVPSVRAPGVPGIGDAIKPDECYIELYIESLRIARARKLATKFQGVAYSFVTLAREGAPSARLTAVSKPEDLAALDQKSLDKVITVSKQMMGATAWRGGTLSLELGLFSVKTGNLLTPFINYVTKISSTAGVSFVDTIKPFLPLITEGMDLIAGQVEDTVIEVGVDTDMPLTESAMGAVIAKPRGSIDPTRLTIDPADRKLLIDGKPLDAGYLVFSIRQTRQKADYGEIPELKEKYAAIQAAIRGNKPKEAEEALVAFRLATIASSDLIPADASLLVKKAEDKLKAAFQGGGISNAARVAPAEPLSALKLYD